MNKTTNRVRARRTLGNMALVALAAVSLCPQGRAQSNDWVDLGFGTAGSLGTPTLTATNARTGHWLTVNGSQMAPGRRVWFAIGLSQVHVPVLGGTLVPNPDLIVETTSRPIVADARLRAPIPRISGTFTLTIQALVSDPAARSGFAFSNAITATFRNHVPSDFNGDGISDLAVAAPEESVNGLAQVGTVTVKYGENVLPSQILHQGRDVNGFLLGMITSHDGYGKSLATGDFNDDGYCDLAIGIAEKDTIAGADVGTVQVIYGSAQGLQGGNLGLNDQLFRQGLNGLAGIPEASDKFGFALCAGDFDGDGCDDLAISAPEEDVLVTNEGVVQVLFGSVAAGLTTANNSWNLASGAILNDLYGYTLTAGDLDGDGDDELVIGQPHKDVIGLANAGAITVLHPGAPVAPVTIHQDSVLDGHDILGLAEALDLFGHALAVGDFDGDYYHDVAVGTPYEAIGAIARAGFVNVIRGSASGLTGEGNQAFSQNSAGVLDSAEVDDWFGYSLAAGDFNDDGLCDLAIAVPREDTNGMRHGAVALLNGSSTTLLTTFQDQLIHQDNPGILSVAQEDERFGWALQAGFFNGDASMDLCVGVPGEYVSGHAYAGSVQLFFGSGSGIGMDDQIWNQSNLAGVPSPGDFFGASLPGAPAR